MISETDLAYAAGLFDGEGSVCVAYKKCHRLSTRHTYQVAATVAMVDEPSILWLCETFRGKFDISNKTKTGRQIYRWKRTGRPAADFLEMLAPYLKLKKARAEAAIKLARLARPRGCPKGQYGMSPITMEEIEAQRPFAEFIRAENMRSNPKIMAFITQHIALKGLDS